MSIEQILRKIARAIVENNPALKKLQEQYKTSSSEETYFENGPAKAIVTALTNSNLFNKFITTKSKTSQTIEQSELHNNITVGTATLNNPKKFGWLTKDHLNPEEYEDLQYQFTRGLDEDVFTGIRNYQTFRYENSSTTIDSQIWYPTPVADSLLIAGALVMPAIYLGAAFVRNRDQAQLSHFEYAHAQQKEIKKTIRSKFFGEKKSNSSSNDIELQEIKPCPESEERTRLLSQNDDEKERRKKNKSSKYDRAQTRLKNIIKELRFNTDNEIRYLPIPIVVVDEVTEKEKIVDCLIVPLATPSVAHTKEAVAPAKQTEDTDAQFTHWIRTGTVPKIATALWKFTNQFSMWYWLIWAAGIFFTGFLLFHFGLAIAVSALFVVPLVLTTPYLVWKLKDLFKPKDEKEETAQALRQQEFDNQLIKQLYVTEKVTEHYKKVFDPLTASNFATEDEIEATKKKLIENNPTAKAEIKDQVAARKEQVDEYIKQLKGESSLWTSKTTRVNRGRLFGFISGFMGASFGLWVITDFLGLVLNIGMFATPPLAVVWGLFVLTVAVATYFGYYKGREAAHEYNEQVKNVANAEKLLGQRNDRTADKVISFASFKELAGKAKELECHIEQYRKYLISEKQKAILNNDKDKLNEIESLLKYAQPLEELPEFDGERKNFRLFGITLFSIHSDRFDRNYTTVGSGVWTWIKKRFWDAASFMDGAGTGAFMGRFLLKGSGAVIPALFLAGHPVGLAVVLSIAITIAVVIGALKIYRYRANEQLRMDKKFISEVQVKAKRLENKLELMRAQEKYLLTHLAKYEGNPPDATPVGNSAGTVDDSTLAIHSASASLAQVGEPTTLIRRNVAAKTSSCNKDIDADDKRNNHYAFFSSTQEVVTPKAQVEVAKFLTRAIAADLENLFKSASANTPAMTRCSSEVNAHLPDDGFTAPAMAVVKAV